MVLDLFNRAKGTTGAFRTLSRRDVEKAIADLRVELQKRKKDERLRIQLADLLVSASRPKEAVEVLNSLADDLAWDGFAAKAIAVLKKIEKIEPGRTDVEEKLVYLINQKHKAPGSGPWSENKPAAEPEADEIGLNLGPVATESRPAAPAPAAPAPPAAAAPAPAAAPPPQPAVARTVTPPPAPSRDYVDPGEFDLTPGVAEAIGDAVPRTGMAGDVPPASPAAGPAEPDFPLDDAVVEEVEIQDQLLSLIGDVFKPSEAPAPGAPPSVGEAPGAEGLTRSMLFESLDPKGLLAVMRKMELVSFKPGEIVVTEGEVGRSLFVVTSGWLRAYVRDPETGASKSVRHLAEGDFFGEISVLAGTRRTATVTAADNCELLEFQKDDLDEIARTHPDVRQVMIDFYEHRTGKKYEGA